MHTLEWLLLSKRTLTSVAPGRPILRMLFAVLICTGLCHQDWSHIHSHSAPERRLPSDEQLFQEAAYGREIVFGEVFSDTSGIRAHHACADGDAPSFAFDLPAGCEVPPPVLIASYSLSSDLPEAGSRRGDCVRNKDPPAAGLAKIIVFSPNASKHFQLSSHDIFFHAPCAHSIRIPIDRLLVLREPGPRHRGAGETG